LKMTWELSAKPGPPPFKPVVNTDIPFMKNATALHVASYLNDYSAAIILLENGASVDCLNAGEETPLHIAANSNALLVVQILLHYGFNINARNCYGNTPAMLAAFQSHDKIVEYLISRGASYYDENIYGETIVYIACRSKRPASVLSRLLTIDCSSLRSTTFYNDTPLDRAVSTNGSCLSLFALLLNWGFDFSSFGNLFFHTSFLDPHIPVPIIKRLIKRIPMDSIMREINRRPDNGKHDSPLVQAAKFVKLEALALLISTGADLDFQGGTDGWPALYYACKWGRLRCVSYLLRAGAKEFMNRGDVVCTAVQAASSFPNIVRWLLVERYTEQPKVCWEASESEAKNVSLWSGIVLVEVPIVGLYSPIHGASSLQRIKELSELRRELRGTVVYY